MTIKEQQDPQAIAQKAKIDSAKIILGRKKAAQEAQLAKVKEQNAKKEERLKLSMDRTSEDIASLTAKGQSSSATVPMTESEDNFLTSFFYGDAGQIISYLVNKTVISRELTDVAKAIKKDPEFVSLLIKIKAQLTSEEPNRNLLTVLKSKIDNRIKNYRKV